MHRPPNGAPPADFRGGAPARHPRRAFRPASIAAIAITLLLLPAQRASADSDRLIGTVEQVSDESIVLDSGTVVLGPGGRVKGDVTSLRRAKAGHWGEAEGRWTRRGLFEASHVEIRRQAPGSSFADGLTETSLRESAKLDASDKIYRDAQVTEYVRKVGASLVPEYARSEHTFAFEVIKDPTLNAFALPSGAIYVHTGLLARLDNEAQLAAILGHEISHVTQKHGQRQYRANLAVWIPAQIGAAVLGVNLQKRSDSPAYQIMVGLGLNLGLSAAVNGYGRTMEDQSDRVGLRYAVDAGYEPRESPEIWDTFNDVYGEEGKIENFFYGNHSTNSVRKQNLSEEIQRHYRDGGAPASDPNAGAARPPGIVNEEIYQKTMLNLTRDNAVEDFKLKRYHLASRGFERVLKWRPGDPVAHHYSGRILLLTDESADGRDRALQEYLKAVSLAPDYAEAHRDLGLLYADLGRRGDARAHLSRYLELAPPDAKDRKDVESVLRKMT